MTSEADSDERIEWKKKAMRVGEDALCPWQKKTFNHETFPSCVPSYPSRE